jgi:homoserine kinase type II
MKRSNAPELSMLWEAIEPEQALSERFGFDETMAAVDWVSVTLAHNWGITIDGCDRLVISAGNLLAWISSDTRRLIAKWSVCPWLFPHLADTAALAAWCEARGLPVAGPIPDRDGRCQVELENVSIGVYPVVDAELLDTEDPRQVVQAGRLLARFHETLMSYPHRFDGIEPPPGQQLVHNDFRAANLLHDGTGIAAVLDFEEAKYRTRVNDLAKTSVLLATRYHRWAPTTPEVRDTFFAAYAEMIPLTSGERAQIQTGITAVMKSMNWT